MYGSSNILVIGVLGSISSETEAGMLASETV
jgi:hypothetical protein